MLSLDQMTARRDNALRVARLSTGGVNTTSALGVAAVASQSGRLAAAAHHRTDYADASIAMVGYDVVEPTVGRQTVVGP